MKISFNLPSKEEVLTNRRELKYKIGSGEKWTKKILGEFSDKGGVYIFHTNKEILYVGKTYKLGNWGNFNERLRRHFQKKASGNSEVHEILKENSKTKKIFLFFITPEDLRKRTNSPKIEISDNGLVLSCEQILIDILKPKYERNKIGYNKLIKGLEKKQSEVITLNFSEIETIIGRKLPASSKYSAWWYPGNHSHTDNWLENNWKVSKCSPKNKKVTFEYLA